MRKIRTSALLALLALVFVLFSAGCRHEGAEPSEGIYRGVGLETRPEEKIYWNGTIDEDFDGSSVLVMMDKNTGGIKKPHKVSFFGDFEKKYIKDLTIITNDIKETLIDVEKFRQIFEIGLPIDSKENVINVIRQLEKIEGILYAGPNFFYYPDTNSDDPFFVNNNQWGLNDTYGIQAPAAWDITIGSNNVRVGIIDTGIAPHPDLNDNLIPGWNFVNDDDKTNDTNGHGTHVAGIVGAVGNNAKGIAGVAWKIKLIPLKINDTDEGDDNVLTGRLIQAIIYAGDHNIHILNLSWGGFSNDLTLKNAIGLYTGLFVCSAGNKNNNINPDKNPYYPATYVIDNKLTVGAIKEDGYRPTFVSWGYDQYGNPKGSNFGSTTVDLFAPGGSGPMHRNYQQILSTYPIAICTSGQCNIAYHHDNGYHYDYGTSMAAPYVAGVAALVKSLHPNMTGKQLKTALRNAVTPVPQLSTDCITGGIINAYKAVNYIPIVGTFNITFNGTGFTDVRGTVIGQVIAGKFYLFTNGTHTIVESGKLSYPIRNFHIGTHYTHVSSSPIPYSIVSYINQSGIGYLEEMFYFYAPAYYNSSYNYANMPLHVRVTSSGGQIIYYGGKFGTGDYLDPLEKIKIKAASYW